MLASRSCTYWVLAEGEVYLVQLPRLPRRNALKVLPTDVPAEAGTKQKAIARNGIWAAWDSQ